MSNRYHPEAAADEVWVGNTDKGIRPFLKPIQSVRLGAVAYDWDGNPCQEPYRPMFIRREDERLYDFIRDERLRRIGMGLPVDP